MLSIFLVLFCWFFAIWSETYFIPSMIPMIDPNLFLLIPILLIIRWKGPECYFIATLFGLTADSFASTPFALSGSVFFLISFVGRWFVIRIGREIPSFIILIASVLIVLSYSIFHGLLSIIENKNYFFYLVSEALPFQILPTILLSYPCYLVFLWIEKRMNIRLAERKF